MTNYKRAFSREDLTVRVWPKGKELLDVIFDNYFENNTKLDYHLTRTDIINFIIIRQLINLQDAEQLCKYAHKLAILDAKRKRLKSEDFKYLEAGIFSKMVSGTFPTPVLDFIADLHVQVDIAKIGNKRVTRNKVVQLLLFETVYALGKEIENEVGLAAFAEELITSYSYKNLVNHVKN